MSLRRDGTDRRGHLLVCLQRNEREKRLNYDFLVEALEMTEVEPVLDFASSERAGRRNALPDVLGSPAGVSPSDLPLKLGELSLTDGPGAVQSPTTEELPTPTDRPEGKDSGS
ncbi:hypothetical protein SKAU_G00404750 [Synaphobranchus kaupii]|uniref:cAMP-dependent protein kinase inhibitor beta n=1 Tax=Synaphobranchus kaupii TaxID=118154 RepID=A0A9Q1E9U8_SYNKA|nr:hypothetical protein SKAU_G00404750 [Synaphobranchus kaupii]